MDFVGVGKAKAKSKSEVVLAAKEARAAREAQGGPGGMGVRHGAALRVQRAAKRLLARAHVAHALRAEWAVPLSEPLGPGALISLVNRYLRFGSRSPFEHVRELCALASAILKSMDRTDCGPTYAHALESGHLAPLWSAQVGRLLAAVVGALERPAELLAAHAQAGAGFGGAPPPLPRDPNAPAVLQTLGPLVRLPLVLADAHKWRLAREGSADPAWSAPADQALEELSASGALPTAVSNLVRAFEPAALSAPVLLSALLLAARPLRAEQAGRSQCAHFLAHILTVPALVERLGAAPAALAGRVLDACAVALCRGAADEQSAGGLGAVLDGGGALALLANAVVLGARAAGKPAAPLAALLALPESCASWALVLTAALVRLASFSGASTASSGVGVGASAQVYHPLLGWVCGFDAGATAAHWPLLERQLLQIGSHALLELLWGKDFAAPLQAVAPKVAAQGAAGGTARQGERAASAEVLLSALRAKAAAVRFLLCALSALPVKRAEVLATAAFSSLLLSSLWAHLAPLLPALHPLANGGGGGLGLGLVRVAAADVPQLLRALELFCRAMLSLLPTLDEAELESATVDDDGGSRRFVRADLSAMVRALNPLAWACVAEGSRAGGTTGKAERAGPPPLGGAESATAARAALSEPLVALVGLLRERHTRKPLCDEGGWQLPAAARVAAEAQAGSAPALAQLCQMPWAADFAARVHVFRALVATDKLAVRGGDGSAGRPRTASELLITVRRKRVLHDGYAQLAHQPPAALRRVLRVRFVSELGLSEAGIDHNGVFKEFMEAVISGALAGDLGLFVATLHSKNFYAHPHAAALHEDAEHLYEFVGRMLGKALYEGVTLDVPLAPFFVRRVLGRASSIDELPELDAQLHSSLTFVRTYTGDVSDLCLSFAIDVERLGAQVSVELRPGGAAIPVDNANRIQYVHLVSDFHLNRQISAQARAVHRGLMGVLHPGWLRLFSAAEVCTLWAGDNVEVDVDDLRRHTDYKGGYHELSPTVRALWQVLRDFSNEERKAFLRFVTSSSGTPLLGFANLEPRFTVQCVSPSGSDNSALGGMLALVGLTPVERQRLPTAATCFNLLKLPDFRSRRVLREKLLLAIQSGSGFELS